MSLSDFLFEGKPPPSVTTFGNSTESIPKWLSDYTQGLVSRANATAGEGYQTYGAPRIADFNANQRDSFDLTKNNVGSYKPGMDLARSFEEQAGGTSTLAAAAPYMTNAGKTFTGANRAEYMDPYIDDVINKGKMDARRFYDESLAPSLNNQFTAAGQYGSSQHEREALKGARDLTEGLETNAMAARSKGYETAGSLFGADASRAGALAQTAGSLAGTDAQIRGQAGRDLATIEQQNSSMGYADAAALGAVGAQEQGMDQANLDLAYGDFQAQRDYPRQQVDWLNSVIHGMPYDKTGSTTNKGPLPGATYGASDASQILGGLSAVKGLWGANADGSAAGWGDIWGDIKGGIGSIFGGGGGGGDYGGGWTGATGGRVYADGGRVSMLTDMMAKLDAKARTRPRINLGYAGDMDYADDLGDEMPQYAEGGKVRTARKVYDSANRALSSTRSYTIENARELCRLNGWPDHMAPRIMAQRNKDRVRDLEYK